MNKKIQGIDAYQKTMISCMGKEKYQAESKKYGQDFATWYVNNKLLEKSLNRMASHGAPKDAVEYLFQKGSQLSLLGLGQPSDWDGMRSLQEKQYNPSKTEKAAAYGVAGLMDFAIMPVGGMKTAVVATAASAGVDVVFSNNGSQESVDTMASKSLFGNGYMGCLKKIKIVAFGKLRGVETGNTETGGQGQPADEQPVSSFTPCDHSKSGTLTSLRERILNSLSLPLLPQSNWALNF